MGKIILNKNKYEFVVIGMGYVGLTYSIHLNTFGYKVVGLETNEKTIKLINNSILPNSNLMGSGKFEPRALRRGQ